MTNNVEDKTYTADEVARKLSITPRTLTRWVHFQKFPQPWGPYERPRRFLKTEVDDWIAQGGFAHDNED